MGKKIIAVVGPTSSGKSDLAVAIAKKFNGEIISADSRQVYKGMNIGTGKITKKEMRGVPHHLLDIISPKRKDFSIAQFKKLADKKIKEITKRGHLPILVGGTGFWIDTVAFNKEFPEVPQNWKLRKKLEKMPTEKIFALLLKLDPERAKNIDKKNPRRLIRAVEIAEFIKKNTKKSKSITVQNNSNPFAAALASKDLPYKTLFVGLDMPDKILYEKIHKRLVKRIKQGMTKEVQRLRKNGVSWKRLDDFGLEYRFLSRMLRGGITKNEMIEQLNMSIKHYAKRQRTWFKRNKDINWLNAANKKTALRQSFALVKKFVN